MVEEKAIYSIEKFLVSRRLMYWQVYLHKAVLGAEMMLVKIIHRAKELIQDSIPVNASTAAFDYFLQAGPDLDIENSLDMFCKLDDYDVMSTIKNWSTHPDKILSLLCSSLIDRRLYKVKLQAEPIPEDFTRCRNDEVQNSLGLSEDDLEYFVFTGVTSNTTYDLADESINILFKDGSIKDISQVDNAMISRNLSSTVKKYYICYWRC